jgi:hypothetical protein
MQQLWREAVGTDLEGKWPVCRRHKPHWHERAQSQRNEQDAGDKPAAALTRETGVHSLQEILICGRSLF